MPIKDSYNNGKMCWRRKAMACTLGNKRNNPINYSANDSDQSIVLMSDKIPNVPIFRLNYILLVNETVDTKFEISRHGQKFMTYVSAESSEVKSTTYRSCLLSINSNPRICCNFSKVRSKFSLGIPITILQNNCISFCNTDKPNRLTTIITSFITV